MPEIENKTPKKNFYVFKKVNVMDKYNFYEYLSVMLDGGVTISETLESVQAKIKNEFFKEKINELLSYVASGDSFSKSMKKIPQVFASSEVSIIEAWETTGKLTDSLAKLSDDLRKTHELRAKVKWAMTYPTIIILFLIASVVAVLLFVIPSIKPLFDTAEVELPASTQALIGTSDFIANNFLLIALFFITVWVLFYGYKNTEKWRANVDYALLHTPLVGKVYKNYILSSIASSLGTLIGAWVWVLKALTLVSKSLNNAVYQSLLSEVITKVSSWNKIVDSMQDVDEENQFFPADFLQMLSVWEKTASLEKVSKKISVQYNREVDYSLSNLTKWIEPIAIMLAGVFVLWFAFAIFGAIMKVTQTVS